MPNWLRQPKRHKVATSRETSVRDTPHLQSGAPVQMIRDSLETLRCKVYVVKQILVGLSSITRYMNAP